MLQVSTFLLNLNGIIGLMVSQHVSNSHFYLLRALRYVLVAPLLMTSTLVLADAQDTVNVIVGMSRTMDDNFFRKPVAPVSETITTSYATLSVNKQYSMQRLNFEYTIRNNAYQNYSSLDSVGNNYKGSWAWSLTPRLTGALSILRAESAMGFADATFVAANKSPILTNEVQNFLMDWAPQGNVHFLGGFTRTVSLNSSNFQPDRGNTTNAIDLGVKYVFPSGSEVTMMQHQRQGEFANINPLLPQTFTENETEAKFNWRVTTKSSASTRVAMVEREHDQAGGKDFSARDYSGWVGDASLSWTPTAKLQLTASAASAIVVYQSLNANYARNNSLSFTPTYACTNKIMVTGSASISERVVEGLNETDTIENASLGLDWTPRRYVSFGAKVQKMSRTSTTANKDFSDLITTLTANINF
ncbi:XrtB/PEP-CTERM-associated polysaccharide biosynthesis outer membrane protein EpsL [Candidatus Methylopumilus turicensis]|uniref:Putative Exopolysaccharide biosynthesis operon protein EpsL n=1 Tax=Candidatus Methylopumilus turicensis TaxID=1581680 RepID=A0A0B7J0H5_9PROT|nr:XrtB/PEP-CTERM-associated polysaccharide biosynthesis outer membrane protein EpsL [Candidatus Methylopumilus turicensis]CEN56262.1 putative Exopolysaccharide biosynthesis operon protein EpsL [Candidatus Methylopumilus turicensis]